MLNVTSVLSLPPVLGGLDITKYASSQFTSSFSITAPFGGPDFETIFYVLEPPARPSYFQPSLDFVTEACIISSCLSLHPSYSVLYYSPVRRLPLSNHGYTPHIRSLS